MQAGKLRHRVYIESRAAGVDTYGQENGAWTTFAPAWAEIVPLTGRELDDARRIQGQVTHTIHIRWVDGVTPKMRVLFGTRTFNVVAVLRENELRTTPIKMLATELV